jgi:type II secretory pathway predicted ATPase ExeA
MSETHHLKAVPQMVQSLLRLRIKHTCIAQVMRETKTLIYPGSQNDMLLMCGPTGVGKSTLARYLVEQATQDASPSMASDAGLIPTVCVEAPSSGEKEFSWRLFYNKVLTALDGDLAAPKVAYYVDPQTNRLIRPKGLSRNSLAALRTAVESSLKARGTQTLIIDEAAHLMQASGHHLQGQLDTLKSLANNSGVQIVLVGSYDLYQLMSLSGQLARRTHVVHFERYREDREEDLRAFRACVKRFQDELPDLWGDRLLPYSAALQTNTLGCIGTLSSVLTRAALLTEESGGWSEDALCRALLTEAQHRQILAEVLDGETAINPGLTRTMPTGLMQGHGLRKTA